MGTKIKKLLAILLTLVMCAGLFPVTAFAEGGEAVTPAEPQVSVTYGTPQNGNCKYTLPITITVPAGFDKPSVNLSMINPEEVWQILSNANMYLYPGCPLVFQINLVNNSGQDYKYKDSSLVVAPAEYSKHTQVPVFSEAVNGSDFELRRVHTPMMNDLSSSGTTTSSQTGLKNADIAEKLKGWCGQQDPALPVEGMSDDDVVDNYLDNYCMSKMNYTGTPEGLTYEQLNEMFAGSLNYNPDWDALESNTELNKAGFKLFYYHILTFTKSGTTINDIESYSVMNLGKKEGAYSAVEAALKPLAVGTSVSMALTIDGERGNNFLQDIGFNFDFGFTLVKSKVDVTIEYWFADEKGELGQNLEKYDNKILENKNVGDVVSAESQKLSEDPEGYIFDRTDGNLEVTGNADTDVIRIYYAGNQMGGSNPNNPINPDDKPDYQQAVIEFKTDENGAIDGTAYQVFNDLTKSGDKYSGAYAPTGVTVVPATGYVFKGWTDKDGNTVANPFIEHSLNGGDHIVYTAKFGKQGTGGTEPGGVNPSPYIPPSPVEFIKEHYAYIIGYPDGMVHPERDITRAETATIFFRMLTEESRKANWKQENPYEDVNIEDWFNNAVSTLTNAGILHGRTESLFEPDESITRAEFAAMAARFFEREGWDKEIPEETFPDIKNHWAEEEISLAYSKNLINGYPDGSFKPDQPITRAEAVTIVNRVLERHPHKDHLLKDMIQWPDNMDKDIWYYADMQEATNSHNFEEKELQESLYGNWTEILPVRDWAALEREWSEYNSSASPGEVVGVVTRMIDHLKSA